MNAFSLSGSAGAGEFASIEGRASGNSISVLRVMYGRVPLPYIYLLYLLSITNY